MTTTHTAFRTNHTNVRAACENIHTGCENPATGVWVYAPAVDNITVVFVCGDCDPDIVGELWSEFM